MNNGTEQMKIFAEAIKMSLRFTIILTIIICGVLGATVFYALHSEQSVSIEAEQENNTNSKQEIVNGTTKN